MEGSFGLIKPKFKLFGRNGARHVWRTKGTAYYRTNTMQTVKHGGGGGIMVWACCTSHGTGKVDGAVYRQILEKSHRERSVNSESARGCSNTTTTLSNTRQI